MKNLLLLLFPLTAAAQPTVAPTPEMAGSPRGENAGGYNVLNTFEFGYRFRTLGGNYGKYRSDVNFGNGVRLLGSQLRVNSREGHGRLFDEISLTTQGLGNDPYQSAVLRIERNRLYRYDLHWRLNEYFNPALPVADGLHLLDTRRRFQDHDVTLLPQSGFKLFFGYTRNSQSGPGLSTIQLFDSRGDEFPLFMDVQRRRNELRLGGEADIFGFKLNVLRGWDDFREDTPLRLRGGPEPGANPTDNNVLTSLRRLEPYQGESPYWRLLLVRNSRRFGMNARYVTVSGRRDFVFEELGVGTDRLGSARNRQITVSGSGSRPVASGSLNLSFVPVERLSITNHTSFHHARMDGGGTFRETDNNLSLPAVFNFQFLGIRSIQTLTDAVVALDKRVSFYGGYHWSTRRIRSREGQSFEGTTDFSTYTQENRLHSGLAGLRLRPSGGLTVQIDAELGRADRPFYPISEKNYHAINGRVQWRAGSWQLSAQSRTFYNANSVALWAHSSRSRQHSVDLNYTRSARVWVEAGYSKSHLDTKTGLAFFAASNLIEGRQSVYISNLHAGHLAVHLAPHARTDLYLGYSIVRDTGDGRPARSVLPPVAPESDTNAAGALFRAQTFPVSFQSPQARISLRLHNRLRWNLGYQYYGYREDFRILFDQNYRAHTGFTSLLWSF